MNIFLKLFCEFFKIGLFAIGGGAATIPFLSKLSDATGWFTKTDLANMIAVSESTPGPIGVNMSTYVGYLTGESVSNPVVGAIIASIGLVLPSVIITLIISGILDKFKESNLVKNVFYGLRPASTGLIAAAAFEIIKISILNLKSLVQGFSINEILNIKAAVFFVILFFAMRKFKFHPIVFIAISAVIGVFIRF